MFACPLNYYCLVSSQTYHYFIRLNVYNILLYKYVFSALLVGCFFLNPMVDIYHINPQLKIGIKEEKLLLLPRRNMVEGVATSKHLGRILYQTGNDWLEMIRNIKRVQKVWVG